MWCWIPQLTHISPLIFISSPWPSQKKKNYFNLKFVSYTQIISTTDFFAFDTFALWNNPAWVKDEERMPCEQHISTCWFIFVAVAPNVKFSKKNPITSLLLMQCSSYCTNTNSTIQLKKNVLFLNNVGFNAPNRKQNSWLLTQLLSEGVFSFSFPFLNYIYCTFNCCTPSSMKDKC